MTEHRPGSLIVLLLLATAFFVSISIMQPSPVRAAPLSVSLNPFKGTPPVVAHGTATAVPGQTIFFSASGASVAVGTGCSIVTDNPSLLASSTISSVKTGGFVTGSFVVGDVPGKGTGNFTYYFAITCGADYGSASTGFTVLPKITLDPSSGTANRTVNIVGAGFRGDATLCSINTPAAATTPLSSCSFTGTGKVSAQFTVKTGIADGSYNVTVFPNLGYNATAQFNKISGPTIFVSPVGVPPGFGTATGGGVPEPKTVTVAGGGFATGSSRSCTLASSGTTTLFASSPSTTCTISSAGTVTGSFAVANGATPSPPSYRINVTDSLTGARASFSGFTVLPQPTIVLDRTSGAAGTPVNITVGTGGTGKFSTFDQGACTISSNPSGLIATPTCLINQFGGLFAASFQVSSSAAAQGYTITITGLHGDFAVAVFTVSPISLTTNPSSGSPPLGSVAGTTVTITGSGFSNLDTSCTVKHVTNSSHPNIVSSLSCSVSSGSLSATFVVAAAATFGAYTLNVTGMPGFDTVKVRFQVLPRIQLNPTLGANGTTVTVTGAGFVGGLGPMPCFRFQSFPAALINNASLASACTLANNGSVAGRFSVSNSPQGVYTVLVVGSSNKDNATAIFTETARVLTLSPDSGFPGFSGVSGTFVVVTGTGFNLTDTSCTLSTIGLPDIIKAGTTTCSIVNGNLAGSFQVTDVGPPPAGVYGILAKGIPTGDTGTGVFTLGVVTRSTSTFTSSSTSLTTTSITTTTSTTQVSTSFSTTTLQTTGVKTESFTSFTKTTVSGLTTTTSTSTTLFSTTVFLATTTIVTTFTTVITHTLGQIIQASSFEPRIDGVGLLAVFILLAPAIFRRLVK